MLSAPLQCFVVQSFGGSVLTNPKGGVLLPLRECGKETMSAHTCCEEPVCIHLC